MAQDAKPAAAPSWERVIFCGYNVRNWLTMERYDGKVTVAMAPKPDAEKAAVVKIIAAIKPDILGLSEVGTDEDVKDLQKRLKDAGLDLPNLERAHGGDTTRSLALMTRLPITARNSQTNLKYTLGDLTLPMQRGILDATVKVADDFQLRCLGVHLKSMREVEVADQALMRRNEAHLLRKHIEAIHKENKDPRIICYGDFNEHRNEPAIDAILGARSSPSVMYEAKIWDRNGETWTHWWDAADSYSRLDYFFLSKALRQHHEFKSSFVYGSRDFDKASDHRPIVITFRREPFPEPEPRR